MHVPGSFEVEPSDHTELAVGHVLDVATLEYERNECPRVVMKRWPFIRSVEPMEEYAKPRRTHNPPASEIDTVLTAQDDATLHERPMGCHWSFSPVIQ